jgi:MFS family permease
MAVVNLIQIASLTETKPSTASRTRPGSDSRKVQGEVDRRENRAMTLLVTVNMINSLGIGIVMPLLPYWFNLRYGVGPSSIGPIYGLTFFLTGISSLFIGRLSEQVGLIRSIVLPRLLGVALLIAIPFMPSFTLAATLYVIRSIVNRGSVGARQAFSLSLVRDHRRGLASSLNAVSWSVPSALGPALGGWIIGGGSLVVPFLAAAGLQLAYAVLFPLLMGEFEGAGGGSPAVKGQTNESS